VLGYVWRDLVRNPRRTLAALVGISLGVALLGSVLFFNDGSRATLTRRAIAPLALDMQEVLTAPLGRTVGFEERITPGALRAGDQARVTLTVANDSSVPANEVVINDEPPPPLRYVPGSVTIDGVPEADVGGRIPLSQGTAHTGLNIGTVPPSTTVRLEYRATAGAAVAAVASLPVQGRISTRENVVPTPANARAAVTLARLEGDMRAIPGVLAADRLSFVDLPRAALHAGDATIPDPVRVYAFTPDYQRHYPSIRVAAGSFAPDAAVLSAEAARALRARPGTRVTLSVPSRRNPLMLPVSGVVDVASAKPLFYSRKASKFEDFLYVPNVVVVSPAMFEREILPAFQGVAATEGSVVKSLPVSEVDLLVARSRLNADPARALAQTRPIADAVRRLAPDQSYLIDNISNTLEVARDDAAVARRMFVFLGLPGILLAIFLTFYSGGILAATQRREHALLRLRGAHRGQLLRMLAAKALALAGAGSIIGTGVGLVSVGVIVGWDALVAVPAVDLARSALLALVAGTTATTVALCVPGIRSLHHEVTQERRAISANPTPAWRRRQLDVALLAAAALAEVVAYRSGAFDPPVVSVTEGQSASLPSRLLLAPLVVWFGGTLVAVRLLQAVTARLRVPPPPGFGPPVRGNLIRSLRQRSWALAGGVVGVGLVVALATSLQIFSATYQAAKAADSKFTVGSDLRVTPSPLSTRPHPADSAGTLRVDGVASATPVVFTLENAVFVGRFDQDHRDLAAIDPATFERTAALSDAFFVGQSAAAAIAGLRTHPDGLLVDARTAEDFSVQEGDVVRVLLARGTKQQTMKPFQVVGIFDRFPGFPLGVNLVANVGYYHAATGLTQADFFLVRASDASHRGVARAEGTLRSGPGRAEPISIESTRTALNKDQSSLTALDVHGLVTLDSIFTTLMSAVAIGIFVFGLLLHRRGEYLTLRALGLPARALFHLLLAESVLVAACGVVAGAPVGIGMGYLFLHVVRPLFILNPSAVVPVGSLLVLAVLPVLAALIAARVAIQTLRRLRPAEVLRET
jgi:putative ABC transport system permease protein